MNKQNLMMLTVNHSKKVKPYQPAWTVAEMAKELGISTNRLKGMIAKSNDAPKPVINNKRSASGRGKSLYYNYVELRKWCKKKLAKVEA